MQAVARGQDDRMGGSCDTWLGSGTSSDLAPARINEGEHWEIQQE